MSEVKSYLDLEELRNRSVSTPYPHIRIDDLNKCVPLVITCLEDGELPILATLKGTTKIIKSISKSALNINKLTKVTSITVVLSETEVREINSILDYMEVARKWT